MTVDRDDRLLKMLREQSPIHTSKFSLSVFLTRGKFSLFLFHKEELANICHRKVLSSTRTKKQCQRKWVCIHTIQYFKTKLKTKRPLSPRT